MSEVFQKAYVHQGCSFVEIYQDCHVFNSGAFDDFSTKTQRQEGVVYLQSEKPMVFGDLNKALTMLNGEFSVTHAIEDAQAHQSNNYAHASQLARLEFPEFPVPVGVFYQESAREYSMPKLQTSTTEDLVNLYKKGACWSRS